MVRQGGGISELYFTYGYQNKTYTFPASVNEVYCRASDDGVTPAISVISDNHKVGKGESLTYTEDNTTVTLSLNSDGTELTASKTGGSNATYMYFFGIV